MVDRQRSRRLRRRDYRRELDPALSRSADSADRFAAGASADPRESRRDPHRGRSLLAAVHQPLAERRHRAGRSCSHRQLPPRLLRPGMDVRDRRSSDRGAHLDGARRPHHLRGLAVAARHRCPRERSVVAADTAGQRSRPSRHDIGRELCARHSRRRGKSPAQRRGALFADRSSARRQHRSQARLVSGFRSADGGRARPERDRQSPLHRRSDDTAHPRRVARRGRGPRTRAVG